MMDPLKEIIKRIEEEAAPDKIVPLKYKWFLIYSEIAKSGKVIYEK